MCFGIDRKLTFHKIYNINRFFLFRKTCQHFSQMTWTIVCYAVKSVWLSNAKWTLLPVTASRTYDQLVTKPSDGQCFPIRKYSAWNLNFKIFWPRNKPESLDRSFNYQQFWQFWEVTVPKRWNLTKTPNIGNKSSFTFCIQKSKQTFQTLGNRDNRWDFRVSVFCQANILVILNAIVHDIVV